MGNGELLIIRVKIPCQKDSSPLKEVLYKITLSEAHVLPPLTECVLPAIIRRVAGTVALCTDVLVEPKGSFTEKYGLVMAASLCDHSKEKIHVRVLNPSAKDIWLFKGTVMGQARAVEEMEHMGDEDEERDKCISVRRIGVRSDVHMENQGKGMYVGITQKTIKKAI